MTMRIPSTLPSSTASRAPLVSPDTGAAALFYQDGAGALPAVTALTTGAEPSSVGVVDVNDDDLDDLVIGSGPAGTLSVYLQAAVGGLPTTPTVTIVSAEVPAALAIGDVNDDGRDDLVVVHNAAGELAVHLQAADNTLPGTPSTTLDVGDDPVSLAIGDLDDDGRPDLAATNGSEGTATVLFQANAFATPLTLPTGEGPLGLVVTDANGDGLTDVIVANSEDFTLSVFLRAALGPHTTVIIPAGEFPSAIAIGDFGGDGDRDLAVANRGEGPDGEPDAVIIYASDLPGRLSEVPAATLDGSFGPEALRIADVNTDGRNDLVVVTAFGTVAIYHQDPVGALPATPSFTVDVEDELDESAVGDVNYDGRNDIVITIDGEIEVYLQEPTGAFPSTPSAFLTGVDEADKVAIDDLNGDGRNDIASIGEAEEFVYVFLQDALGQLPPTPSSAHATGAAPDMVAIGDLDADGRNDFVVPNADDDELGVFFQTAAGTLPAAADLTLTTGASPEVVLIGDVNSDGLNDLAVLNAEDGEIGVYLNDAATGLPLTASLVLVSGDGTEKFELGDLNGDGREDLVAVNIDTGMAVIYLQDIDGLTSDPNQQLNAGLEPDALAVGDLNGDGRWDLAVSNDGGFGVPADNTIRVYLQE